MNKILPIFHYLNYRTFLGDYFEQQKKTQKHFSARQFSRHAGLKTPGYLGLVMRGDRNLSPDSMSRFARALRLGQKETLYFEALVLLNQAQNQSDREYYYERLHELRPKAELTGVKKDQYDFFRSRYFVIIREMVALPHFQMDYDWIASHMKPPMRPDDARHAIDTLLKLKLIKKKRGGKLVQTNVSLTTPPEVGSMELMNLNLDLLNLSKENLFSTEHHERDYTTLTIPLSYKMLPKLKDIIRDCREKIIELVNRGAANFDEVYQMNVQLFPVTKTLPTEKND